MNELTAFRITSINYNEEYICIGMPHLSDVYVKVPFLKEWKPFLRHYQLAEGLITREDESYLRRIIMFEIVRGLIDDINLENQMSKEYSNLEYVKLDETERRQTASEPMCLLDAHKADIASGFNLDRIKEYIDAHRTK